MDYSWKISSFYRIVASLFDAEISVFHLCRHRLFFEILNSSCTFDQMHMRWISSVLKSPCDRPKIGLLLCLSLRHSTYSYVDIMTGSETEGFWLLFLFRAPGRIAPFLAVWYGSNRLCKLGRKPYLVSEVISDAPILLGGCTFWTCNGRESWRFRPRSTIYLPSS